MESILLSISIILISFGLWAIVKRFKHRAFLNYPKLDGYTFSKDLYAKSTEWGGFASGIFMFLILPWNENTYIIPAILIVELLLVGIYLVIFRPTFKYSDEQQQVISKIKSYESENKLYLFLFGSTLIAISFALLVMYYFRCIR
jgi:hypothetical protein